jgi:hypothetical protein
LAHQAQSIRSPWAEFYPFACGLKPVVFTKGWLYLSARAGGRNEAVFTILAGSEPLQ